MFRILKAPLGGFGGKFTRGFGGKFTRGFGGKFTRGFGSKFHPLRFMGRDKEGILIVT